jgi:pyruvate,water dikinase
MGFYEAADYRSRAPEMCGFFGAHFYINLSCIRMQAVRNPAITVEQLDLAFFGERPDTPPYAPHPDDDKPHLQPVADAHMAFVMSASEWPELLEEKALAASLRATRPPLSTLTDAELIARVRELQPVIRRLSRHQLIAAGSSGIAPGMLAAVAQGVGDPTLPMRLLAGLGDVDSAAPSFALWDISRLIRASTELTMRFDAGPDTVLDGLESSGSTDVSAFAEAFAAFLYEFGSRGPNEWELSAHTWETDPGIALAALDRIRLQPDAKAPTAQAATLVAEREATVAEVRSRLAVLGDDALTATFEGALVAGNMMIFRERAKTTLVRALHEVRVTFRELGRRHAASGDLVDAEHIFMLTGAELDDFVTAPAEQRQRLADRAGDWAQLWELEPPFFISFGVVPPLGDWARKGASGAPVAVEGDVLTGVPGSPGVVRGRARIVLDPADPPDLVPGDIMVAPLTDPAWTPLFLAVDAVVVNVGGQISHAVIVSRELGLPCVVSVADATERIADGAIIEVDGYHGTVRILGTS